MSTAATIHWLATDPDQVAELIQTAGVTPQHLSLLQGPKIWGPGLDKDMQMALREIIFCSARICHYQDIDLPAQYVAAIIAEFVHHNNWMNACHLFSRTPRS